jgi:hypothetical protein
MNIVISVLLFLVGIVHFLPLIGVMSNAQLQQLYGIEIDGPNLSILMRHRAVLFGLLGGLLIYAAFDAKLQPVAIIAGLISMVSFVVLAQQVQSYNERVRAVVVTDVIGAIMLTAALVLLLTSQ